MRRMIINNFYLISHLQLVIACYEEYLNFLRLFNHNIDTCEKIAKGISCIIIETGSSIFQTSFDGPVINQELIIIILWKCNSSLHQDMIRIIEFNKPIHVVISI